MATGAIAGFKGALYTSTSTSGSVAKIAEIREWTISGEQDPIDVTSADSSGDREYIPGLRGWTASAEHLYAGDSTGQTQLFDMVTQGIKGTLEFYPQGSSTGFPIYSGQAFMTSWELASPNDDAAAVSVEWQGDGALTASSSS